MKILSISTATNFLTVAVNEDEQIIAQKEEKDHRNHSEHLDPLIADLLHQQNLTLKDIDRFAVAIGPGSYTGLRIGITTVKMFASVLNKELVGISTLQAMAHNITEKNILIVPTIDARNDNFFAGAYQNVDNEVKNIIPDGHYHIDTLLDAIKKVIKDGKFGKIQFVGTGMPNYEDMLKEALGDLPYEFGNEEENQIHAGKLGQLAVSATPIDPDVMVPKYLRRTQAEMDWHKKTGQPFAKDSSYVEEV